MDKDKILEKLSQMPLVELDEKYQTKTLEIRDIIVALAKNRDTELVYKHDLRKKLLAEGNSFSKVENMLRSDETLFNLKRLIMGLATNKKKLELEMSILKDLWWAAKNTGG